MALPQAAHANGGTALMWAEAMHQLFGNLVIGVLEGLLVAWLFTLPRKGCVVVLILANYLSGWIGYGFIRGSLVRSLPMDLNNAWNWFWVLAGVTYIMTLALEWPFIAWLLRRQAGWFRCSLRGSLIVQSASYVLLFGIFWSVSGTSLYTEMDIVAPSELTLPRDVEVFYIDPQDGNVYRRKLTDAAATQVFALNSRHENDRLFTRVNAENAERWDLVARLENEADHRKPAFIDVLTNLAVVAPQPILNKRWTGDEIEGTWLNLWDVELLPPATTDTWEFFVHFFVLTANRQSDSERVVLSYETPFGNWVQRNATHLPGDVLLFQLGKDQICAFDPVQRKVALLWHGRGPVPVIDQAAD